MSIRRESIEGDSDSSDVLEFHAVSEEQIELKRCSSQASALASVECPICRQQVNQDRINKHIDSGCSDEKANMKKEVQKKESAKEAWSSLFANRKAHVRERRIKKNAIAKADWNTIFSKKKGKSSPSPLKGSLTQFITCPACSKSVPQFKLNYHLDKECKSLKEEVVAPRNIQMEEPLVREQPRKIMEVESQQEIQASEAKNKDGPEANLAPKEGHLFFSQGPLPASAFEKNPKKKSSSNCGSIAAEHIWSITCTSDRFDIEFLALNSPMPARSSSSASSVNPAFECSVCLKDPSTSQSVSPGSIRMTCRIIEDLPACDTKALPASKPKRFRFAPSVLKSLLQKNVRLCRPMPSVRCALSLIIQYGFLEFIRRVLIIAVEDAIVHPALPFLMCFSVAAHKGFQPSAKCLSFCLSVVYELAAVRVKDYLMPEEEIGEDQTLPISLMNDFDELGLSSYESNIIRCLLVRSYFGGMKGDTNMLQKAASLWMLRFGGLADVSPPSVSHPKSESNQQRHYACRGGPWMQFLDQVFSDDKVSCSIDVEAVECIHDDDVVLSAIDCHCSGINQTLLESAIVRSALAQEIRPWNEERASQILNSLIWTFRSSRTPKKPLQRSPDRIEHFEELKKLFQKIEAEIDHASTEFIVSKLL